MANAELDIKNPYLGFHTNNLTHADKLHKFMIIDFIHWTNDFNTIENKFNNSKRPKQDITKQYLDHFAYNKH